MHTFRLPEKPFWGCVAACLLALSACAPMQHTPPAAVMTDAAALNLSAKPVFIPPEWWRQLNDDALNQLIDTTLAQSPDLTAAAARLRQAQAGSGLAASQNGVQAALSADGVGLYHESISHPNSLSERIFGNSVHYGNIQLKGQWAWDLWGEHKSELAAALGKERALAYEIAQTRLLLAQAITAQYFQLQTLFAQQALLRERIAIKKQQEQLLRDRVRAGLLPPSQLFPVQNAQQQFAAAIRDLDEKAALIRHALSALSGQPPHALNHWRPKPSAAVPAAPVATLSADILGKRADLAAQREAVLSRGHLVHAAEAKFYPNIRIRALIGRSALEIGDLPSMQSWAAGLLPSITLPIFTSGALQANLSVKQAEYDEQVARYNKSVYQALKEAADALSQYESAREAAALQQQTLRLAQRQQTAAADRVKAGVETRLAVLTAQDEVVQARSRILQAQLQQKVAWAALNTVFGGGFRQPE